MLNNKRTNRVPLPLECVWMLVRGFTVPVHVPAYEFERQKADLSAILERHPNQYGCPLGEKGSWLLVQEPFVIASMGEHPDPQGRAKESPRQQARGCLYQLDHADADTIKWRAPAQMPKWACRLNAEIVETRVEPNPDYCAETRSEVCKWNWVACLRLPADSEFQVPAQLIAVTNDGVEQVFDKPTVCDAVMTADQYKTPDRHMIKAMSGDDVMLRWDRERFVGENKWRVVSPDEMETLGPISEAHRVGN